jgi:hypothetical protein
MAIDFVAARVSGHEYNNHSRLDTKTKFARGAAIGRWLFISRTKVAKMNRQDPRWETSGIEPDVGVEPTTLRCDLL